MIKVNNLKEILNIKDEEIKKLDIEQLRVLLGVFRYRVRGIEREINHRCSDKPFGNITALSNKE